LRPAEADPHHGKAEVARGLHEVAGEDAESAGIGVELLVEPVLHREVGDERRHAEENTLKAAFTRAFPERRADSRPGAGV
jgi:hypothetical protein